MLKCGERFGIKGIGASEVILLRSDIGEIAESARHSVLVVEFPPNREALIEQGVSAREITSIHRMDSQCVQRDGNAMLVAQRPGYVEALAGEDVCRSVVSLLAGEDSCGEQHASAQLRGSGGPRKLQKLAQ